MIVALGATLMMQTTQIASALLFPLVRYIFTSLFGIDTFGRQATSKVLKIAHVPYTEAEEDP